MEKYYNQLSKLVNPSSSIKNPRQIALDLIEKVNREDYEFSEREDILWDKIRDIYDICPWHV
jgi:hypothetical protein